MPIYKMKGKKDGKQKYRVQINYTDADGTPRQTDRVVYGQEEAKLLEMKLNQELKESPPEQSITVQELYDEYMAAKRFEVKEATWDKSRRILEMHILHDLGAVALDELSLPRVQVWKQSVEGRLSASGQALKLKTKQNIFKELSAMLNYATKMEYLARNPLQRIGGFKDPNAIAEPMDYYTADEFTAFISAAKRHALQAQECNNLLEWNYYVFFALAFYTGMRKGDGQVKHTLNFSELSKAPYKASPLHSLQGAFDNSFELNRGSHARSLAMGIINFLS